MKTTACIVAATVTLCGLHQVQADDIARKVSSKPANVAGTTAATTTEAPPTNLRDKPAYNIPFPQPASGFQDNPNPDPIKIGPASEALNPMGESKPLIKFTPVQDKYTGSVDIPARPVVEIPQATEKNPSAGTSQQVETISPFLDWIQNTKNAAEIARQQRRAIEQTDLKNLGPNDGSDQDLFLNIRFPYVGNQDLPPGGGSVTYSMPQR